MKKKHIELLNYLLEQDSPVTSTNLSDILQISIRSVKNYVTEINSFSKTKVILSTKKGYLVDKPSAKKLLSKFPNNIPQNYMERAFYIIKQLLIENFASLDLYDLCDILYISYSTLKLDIGKMNKVFYKFNVSFVCEKDMLRIVGEEKNKRKLVSHVLFEEANNNFIDLSILKKNFGASNVDKISQIISGFFKKYNYYINDFSYMNFILHLIILIDRVKFGKYVVNSENYSIENTNEKLLVNGLCSEIENSFNIKLSKDEKFEIYILLKTNANYSITNNINDLKKLVGPEIISLTNDIAASINSTYLINLLNDSFLTPFSLHLKSLLIRLKSNTYIKNPMVDNIKKHCPIIYDIAIFISFKINKLFNVEMSEDEIAYLALHVGAEIERQKTNKDKVRCVLLCPEYINMGTKLYNEILFEFGSQLSIIACVSYEYELATLDFDLLITTLNLEKTKNYEIIVIPPFSENIDKKRIYNAIDKITSSMRYRILKENFNSYFNEEIFFSNIEVKDKEELISILSDKMLRLDYVNNDFKRSVLERENASSTAFGNIAIPHSVHMNALKTSIAVVISKKGIKWDDNLVNLVLLIAINEFDKKTFKNLYEAIISLFDNNDIINLTKNCTTFTDFKNLVYYNIETNL